MDLLSDPQASKKSPTKNESKNSVNANNLLNQ